MYILYILDSNCCGVGVVMSASLFDAPFKTLFSVKKRIGTTVWDS